MTQIIETCIKIYELSKDFRNEIITNVINFAYPKKNESTRTINVIKNNLVLAT